MEISLNNCKLERKVVDIATEENDNGIEDGESENNGKDDNETSDEDDEIHTDDEHIQSLNEIF